ncbi:hypothetical protein Bca52824_016234 [Brassica carinata]|uniref:Disease resistance protein n=1 Tax=Brassica carinata TaxID=52824 RepID=A0A8X7W4R3_BRACI|nr:hypothetical protein Bca52824_016234 [Brassica carinata]
MNLIWDSLADNVIEELPASLWNLVQLKSLCLDNNQIPDGLLKDCKSLQNLSLQNNPISMDEFQLDWTLKTVLKKSLLVMNSMHTSLWQQG